MPSKSMHLQPCPHGELSRHACLECLHGDPGPPPAPTRHQADRWIRARIDGHCANDPAHRIDVGDPIGLVNGIGWLCEACIQ